jgi:hypothetical protein
MVDLGTLTPGRDDVFELLITAQLPGVNEKDLDVTVSGDTLTIKAEKKVEREGKGDDGRYVESRSGLFSRSIRLPFEVKDEEMDATFDEACSRSASTRCRRRSRPCAGLRSGGSARTAAKASDCNSHGDGSNGRSPTHAPACRVAFSDLRRS